LHAMIAPGEQGSRALLSWRETAKGDGLRLELRRGGAALIARRDRSEEELACDRSLRFVRGDARSVQVLDHGDAVTVGVDGRALFGGPVQVPASPAEGTRVGFAIEGGWRVRDFECHGCEVEMPAVLRIGAPWMEVGSRAVLQDSFGGR